ncbi:hypothetical protein EVG20_g2099 [Dentipellis fragilis]|uniref:Uncharacterized protein n=1 Tax=Dentipellis fragilis TaxID=205917 RepID=A0A4Y9ZAN8_9AGAM|nr:hypothetical protein EVG20_g2099 [Dentipellis fragilis]
MGNNSSQYETSSAPAPITAKVDGLSIAFTTPTIRQGHLGAHAAHSTLHLPAPPCITGWDLAMGCIPSKQSAFNGGDVPRATKPRKYKKPKNLGPASPVIPEDAPPWVKGHRVVAFSDDHVAGDVYLKSKAS